MKFDAKTIENNSLEKYEQLVNSKENFVQFDITQHSLSRLIEIN